jgi:Protein of unknown function (DUF4232)
MRPTALVRFLLPGIVAGLAWVASDWVARLAFASPGLLERTLLGALAPDTMSVGAEARWPAGALTALAWAVGVGAAYLLVTTLLRPLNGRAGFAAAWFATIVAGALVTGIVAVATTLAAVADPLARAQVSSAFIAVAAHWGLVWGWVAALATVVTRGTDVPAPAAPAVAPRAPARRRIVSAAIALAAALVAIVAVEPIAEAAWHSDLQAQEPAPEPVPTATPVPEIAPGEWQVDPLWCTDNQLEFAASEPDAAAGSRGMRVVATNVSGATCVLEGYPDVAFSDPVTSALDVRIEHGSAMGGDDAGPVRLELAGGDSATATIAWRAMAASDLEPAAWLHLAPYHGGIRQMLQVETDITGGEVVVGAWAAAPAAGA